MLYRYKWTELRDLLLFLLIFYRKWQVKTWFFIVFTTHKSPDTSYQAKLFFKKYHWKYLYLVFHKPVDTFHILYLDLNHVIKNDNWFKYTKSYNFIVSINLKILFYADWHLVFGSVRIWNGRIKTAIWCPSDAATSLQNYSWWGNNQGCKIYR